MRIVNVRIKYGGQIMTYECGELNPCLGDWVVVKCDDTTYLGQVVTAPIVYEGSWPLKSESPDTEDYPSSSQKPWCKGCNGDRPGRSMLRLATGVDLANQAENDLKEKEALAYCLERISIQKLEMKMVAVEMVLDSSKAVFYYTAEGRVDFRQLVKELVSRFRNRIEMRQIGVRQEARMVGGLGCCGRHCCCSGFLANFAPVSVKMAKECNLSLSPTKISGVCGRLLCCLAFEHQGGYDHCRGDRHKPQPRIEETPERVAVTPELSTEGDL